MAEILDRMMEDDFEQIMYCHDPVVGLQAMVGIHDTTLGPAMGGVRMREYVTEEEALQDLLRLSRAMTMKSALAELDLGGGAAIIFGDPDERKTEGLFRSFGRFVESLGGRIFIAEDLGTNEEDMELIGLETRYVSGIGKIRGGSGNPSVKAAYGVFLGIKAACEECFGEASLRGHTVAVQGLGSLGGELVRLLIEDGARLVVADRKMELVERLQAKYDVVAAPPERIFEMECDIFSPCALGGILNERTIPTIKAKIIAGGANNQLANDDAANLLLQRGITYVPDFVINSGGLTNAAEELLGYNESMADKKVAKIFSSVKGLLTTARLQGVPAHHLACIRAMARINQVREVQKTYVPGPRRAEGVAWA
jgi:leucine dehydrogenase